MNKTKKHLSILLFLGMVLFLNGPWAQAAGLEADWVLYNGKILTADTEDPAHFTIAEAVAIYDGKFVVVGSNQEALETAGASTRRIDLAGKTVLPGLVETHLHVHTQTARHHLDRSVSSTDPPLLWTSKEEGLAQLRTLALQKKPGEWIIVGVRSRTWDRGNVESSPATPSITELDQAAPNQPVVLKLGDEPILVNNRALNILLERYPQGIPVIVKGQDGKPTGLLKSGAARTMPDFWPELSRQKVAELAPFYRKELEEVAARGVTTVGTRVDTNYSLRFYQLLDQREDMPVRMAYGTQMAAYHPQADLIYRRVPGLAGHGTPWLWLSGAAPGATDGRTGEGGACVHGNYPRDAENFPQWRELPFGPNGNCRLSQNPEDTILRDSLLAAARFGWSVTNTHLSGDRGLDEYLDVLEEADKKYGITDLRFSADHCTYITEEQALRAKQLGVSFTCTFPSPFVDAEKGPLGVYKVLYGIERAADSVAPYRRLVRLGLKPSAHCESHRGWAFSCLQYAITRKEEITGQVWGPQQRINRREALYTYTRWASWHAWKEKYIGSIEPGKWADLVVLDQDYLTVPEDDIAQISPLLTIVGGKISYSEPSYAASEGLPTVGFQAPPDWWERNEAGSSF